MREVSINLNKLTQKYSNRQDEWPLIRNAIKSAILDAKLQYGSDAEIYFIDRYSDNIAFDLAINGVAKQIFDHWEI
ncbi:MAG: hypothetical protein K0S04_3261 [Herbinix sp.]|jgi:hypothetical protein|nr:hypothetical protein [Herbinix sp.]